jgi:hypothetical protein
MPRRQSTAEHWRERAEEARSIAETMRDEGARKAMFQVADGYEAMAERVEKREALARGPPKASKAAP